MNDRSAPNREQLHLSDALTLRTNALCLGLEDGVADIFDLVTDYLGLGSKEVPVVPPAADDVPVVSLDASETLKAFGWQARVGFAETIKRQLAWYDRYGISDVFSHLKAPTQTK